jgi:chromosomal replication initiator protein
LSAAGLASLTQIGDLFGGKTHSAVLYACQKLESQMKQDAELAEAVQQLCARLKGGKGQ